MGFYNSPRIITDDLIFSIDAANIKSWSGPTPVPVGTDYGYFAGGTPGAKSIVDRIDFNNDTATASIKGPLNNGKQGLSAASNTSYGYFGGGNSPRSSVDRIDYSNDTPTATAVGNLSVDRYGAGSTGNDSYGYFAGGDSPATSSVDRIDYSNDSAVASPKGPLTATSRYNAAAGNLSYGYFKVGNPSVNSSKVERIDYSNDTATAVEKGPLTSVRYWIAATGNSSYGYYGGDGPYAGSTLVDRVDYSSDTSTALARGPLAHKQSLNGATGSSSFGYFAAGYKDSGKVSSVDRLDYSSDTTTAVAKGPLNNAISSLAAASSRANGLPTSNPAIIWKDTSKNGDNATVEGATHQDANSGSFAFNGTSNYASNDDKANLQLGSGNFTFAAWIKPNASTQGTDFGYFGGGYNPSAVQSGINRIDFSNDTATASQVSQFAGASPSYRNQLRTLFGVANLTHAYWGGGTHGLGSESTSIFRLDFSNDTTNTSAIGNLPAAASNLSAVGNASYGYINGDSKTTVNRIDYSNDDTTTAVKGDLNQTRVYPGATGNSSYGWFGGGGKSSVDRVDYSNDTATASARGDLTRSATFLAATGNSNYGYWGGGQSGPISTYVDRVDYSNDTPTASLKGPLTAARYRLGATGNSDYGYFAGGAPGPLSTVDRIDYSNDTVTASAKGSLNISPGINGKMELAGASSRANALPTSDRSNNQGIISYSDSGGNEDATTCQFDTDIDGKVKFSSTAGIVTSTSALSSGTWAHAAVTRTDNTISVYVNGVLENTGITTHTFSDYAKVTIGANRPRSTFFKGDIAQVQIYKKALSSDEVQQNYRSIKKRFDL